MKTLILWCWLLLLALCTFADTTNMTPDGYIVVYNPVTKQYQLQSNNIGPFHNPGVGTTVTYTRTNYAPVSISTNWSYSAIDVDGVVALPVTTNFLSLNACSVSVVSATIFDVDLGTNGDRGSISVDTTGTNVLWQPTTDLSTNYAQVVVTDCVGYRTTNTVSLFAVVPHPPIADAPTSVHLTSGAFWSTYIVPIYFDPADRSLQLNTVSTNGDVSTIPSPSFGGYTLEVDSTPGFVGTNNVQLLWSSVANMVSTGLVTVITTNWPPSVIATNVSILENTSFTVRPLILATVNNGGGYLTITNASVASGTLTFTTNLLTFLPPTNTLGTFNLHYTVSDNVAGTNAGGLVVVTVTNAPVLAPNFALTVADMSTNTVNVLTNGGGANLISVSGFPGVSVVGTNMLLVCTNNYGLFTIAYVVSDTAGNTANGNISVFATNLPPVAGAVTNLVGINMVSVFPLLSNATDPEGHALTIVTNATLTVLNALSAYAGFSVIGTNLQVVVSSHVGTNAANYTVADSFGATNRATYWLCITDMPPLAHNDSYLSLENSTNLFSPLANDVLMNPNGTLTLASIAATNCTATIAGNNVTFLPTTNFIGTATIGYAVNDGYGGTAAALVSVLVTNSPPTATVSTNGMTENSSTLLNATTNITINTPGGTNKLTTASSSHGAAYVAGTNINFTPANNYVGTTTVTYAYCDGIGSVTNNSYVWVLVTNNPPTVVSANYSMAANTTGYFGVLTNATVHTTGGTLSLVSAVPNTGSAVVSGTNIVFTPTSGFTGTVGIQYTVSDNIGGINTSGFISVSVTNVVDNTLRFLSITPGFVGVPAFAPSFVVTGTGFSTLTAAIAAHEFWLIADNGQGYSYQGYAIYGLQDANSFLQGFYESSAFEPPGTFEIYATLDGGATRIDTGLSVTSAYASDLVSVLTSNIGPDGGHASASGGTAFYAFDTSAQQWTFAPTYIPYTGWVQYIFPQPHSFISVNTTLVLTSVGTGTVTISGSNDDTTFVQLAPPQTASGGNTDMTFTVTNTAYYNQIHLSITQTGSTSRTGLSTTTVTGY